MVSPNCAPTGAPGVIQTIPTSGWLAARPSATFRATSMPLKADPSHPTNTALRLALADASGWKTCPSTALDMRWAKIP